MSVVVGMLVPLVHETARKEARMRALTISDDLKNSGRTRETASSDVWGGNAMATGKHGAEPTMLDLRGRVPGHSLIAIGIGALWLLLVVVLPAILTALTHR